VWNGALCIDANADERSDLLLVGPGSPPVLLLREPRGGAAVAKWFTRGTVKSPPLLHAQAIDLDLDGPPDVVGLSKDRRAVLLHSDSGTRLVHAVSALGPDEAAPGDVLAVAAADLDGDCRPEVLLWAEREGLRVLALRGNEIHGLKLRLSGHRRVEAGGLI